MATRPRSLLRAATDLAIYRGSVVRMLLRTFDGRVVFSDNGSQAGAVPASGTSGAPPPPPSPRS